MAYPKGVNTANFNNCATWNNQTGNVTAVGRNGGASAYGTFDQAGNIEEKADVFFVGGSYSSSGSLFALNRSVSAGSINASTPTTGFRLSGINFSQVYITFNNPIAYVIDSPLVHSFSIINEEAYSISLNLTSSFSNNIVSTSWTASYPVGSSGPQSGSLPPTGSITIAPNTSITFNLVSTIASSSKNNINISINISPSLGSTILFVQNNFSASILAPFPLARGPSNYPALFSNFRSLFSPATINEFVTVGDPGNNTSGYGFGAVNYVYSMTKYEITNIEYCVFLNSVDPQGLNPQGIYDSNMGSQTVGGINFISSNQNGQKYVLKTRMGNKPVNFVDWGCAARYCNWLQNGGLSYTTTDSSASAPQNTGAYNIGTLTSGNIVVPRTPNALFLVPVHDEWIKAAHYKGNGTNAGYWNYATKTGDLGSSFAPSAVSADSNGNGLSSIENNSANIGNLASWAPETTSRIGATTVGTNGTSSIYGLFDMLGNVSEITTAADSFALSSYIARGGNYATTASLWYTYDLSYASSYQTNIAATTRSSTTGFRIVSIIRGDIALSVTSNKTFYNQNENTTITLNIVNTSSFSIDSNRIVANLSGPSFDSISWTAIYGNGSSGPSSGSGNLDTIISIGGNDSITFNFTIKTTTTATSSILFSSVLTPNSLFQDTNNSNNSASISIPVLPTDLSISLVGPATYSQNINSQYVLTVENNGPTNIPNATVNLTPSGASISSLTWTANHIQSSGATSGANSLSNLTLGIASSGSTVYTINITPSQTTINNLILTGSVAVPAGVTDTNLFNNTTQLVSTIRPTDVNIDISGAPRYTQNINNTITATITNSGQYSPSGTLNITLPALIPPSSINWTASYSSGGSGPTSGSGNIATSGLFLANNSSAIYNITYRVPSGVIVPIDCTGSVGVRSPLTDSQLSNNTDIFTINMSDSDVAISGNTNNLFYENSAAVSCELVVINNSPNNISGILVSIPSPINISSSRWIATYINGSGLLSGSGSINTIVSLNSGGSVRYGIDSIASSDGISPIIYSGLVSLPSGLGFVDPNISNNLTQINIPHSLIITNVIKTASTCDNNGAISINVDGGIPPYRYSLGSVSAESSNNTYKFNNLEPGIYNITVIDSTGYIAAYPEEIVIDDANIEFTLNNILPPTLLDSYAKIDFTIYGLGPFNLIFTNKETQQTIEIGAFETKYLTDAMDNEYRYSIDSLITPGSYSLTVSSLNNSCSISQDIIVPNISPMSVNVSVVPDEPININAPVVTLDILDTLLIPYKHIQTNSDLWQLIKDYNLKDNIYLWINDERYEYRIVRTMLDKYCLNEDKIEILKLGNSFEDWYFYLYIAPSINLTTNSELLGANLALGTSDGSIKHNVVIGLSDSGQIENDSASLIKGSLIVNGIAFPDIITGLTANVSIGVSELGLGTNDFELRNIHKTHLTNIYTTNIVTAINFLENFNVLNEYVSISQTTCSTSKEDYDYLVQIKQLLLSINNFNNLGNVYLFNNNNTLHTGQLNCFAAINTPMITDLGNVDNAYTTEYFTFNTDSEHVSKFIINNQELKNVGVISGIDSRYIIARIVDNYGNRPRSIIYENGTTVPYDEHFVKSQQIIQQINPSVLHDFVYGDVLIYVPSAQSETELTPDPSPTPPTTSNPTPTPTQTTPIVEMSKDSTNTGSLQVNVFPLNTKCIIYGPQKYEHIFTGNTVFINAIPGVYKIVGDNDDIKTKNLYQNEYRIVVDKNSITTQTVEFFSYANKLFISEKDH